jgi:hypothetical protein
MIVMVVAAFPRVKLDPELDMPRVTVKSSSFSTASSALVVTDIHTSAPLPEPGENVRDASEIGAKSPAVAV